MASQVVPVLTRAQEEGGLVIAAPVYVELLAHPKATQTYVDRFLAAAGIEVDFRIEEAVWRETARAFRGYVERRRRSSGGHPKRLLVDFLIGAHAMLKADRLYTLDPGLYAQDFPNLKLMT